jgi:hypothetical protein
MVETVRGAGVGDVVEPRFGLRAEGEDMPCGRVELLSS